MLRWQQEFIYQLKSGIPADKACRSAAGMSLKEVLEVRENDPQFADAWDDVAPIETGPGKAVNRRLNGTTLEALLWAQCTDEQTAAYFNLEVPEFMERIDGDPELRRIHKLARKGGQAQILLSQMDSALTGNVTMQQWQGKQHLQQADKTEQKLQIEQKPPDIPELARRMLYMMAEAERQDPTFRMQIDSTAVELQPILVDDNE